MSTSTNPWEKTEWSTSTAVIMCGEKQEVQPTFPTKETMIAEKKYSR